MCSAYVWPRSVQGQGHNLRLNIVWLYFVSALYLLNPWWDLQITLDKCQLWWDDVQCICLTKVSSWSRSQSKHCMTVFRVRSISFEPLVDFTNNCTNVKYIKTICSAYVWPRSVQGQGHSLRFNIVWLYLVSALYLLSPWWYLQITLLKCQLCCDDVQCLCLTKFGSRSKFKIKRCMTVFWVRSLSFEPLVGFTNYFPKMLAIITRCAVPMFDQGQGKKLTLFPMLHMGYSSPSVIALDYDFTFLYKKKWFHPVT